MRNITNDVLRAVREFRYRRAGDIARLVQANRNSVRSALARLESRGEITRVGRGEYTSPITFSKTEEDVDGWYLSGLQYNRNIGIKIYGIEDIEEAELILREYAISNINNYNDDFYGIGSIPYDGISPINEVIEVNL